MTLVSTASGRSGFTDYLQSRRLPAHRADVRRARALGVSMALVEHAPSSHGVEYDPVDELIISVVLRSSREPVVRDLGEGEYRFTETPGQVLLTPPRHASYWRFESSPLILHLGVPVSRLAAVIDADDDTVESEIMRATRVLHDDPLIGQMASRLWASGRQPSRYGGMFAENCLDAILSLLLDMQSPEEADASPTVLAPWRLRKVMDAIADSQPSLSVAELARLVDLSPDHFSRAFKSATGRSPHQLISETRIERAKTLLRDSSLSMTDLALELGFSSSAHFSSRFRQLTGLSPTEWKERFSVRDA